MNSKYLMGLDAGGGGGRCLLIELEDGRIVTTHRSWAHRPVPGTGGWGFDLDVERCWSLLAEAAREAMGRADASPGEVLGVATTSMRHSTIVIDRDGHAILAAPTRDARASAEGMELGTEHGEEFHRRTGHWPSPIFTAARMRWLANQVPEDMERATAFLSMSDWIAYRLCGQIATEPSQAGETLLFDLESDDWAWDLIGRLDLPRHLFPAIQRPGARLGDLSAQAADALGLKAGIPVAVGGADTQCGLLGMGAVAPGQMAAIAGTTTPIQFVLQRPLVDPEARMWTGHHVVPGLWVLESNAGAMGEALDWFADAFYPQADYPLAHLVAEAAESSPGAAGILSTVGAEVMNACQMVLPVGSLTLTHLTASHDPARRRHLARAILEGAAYAVQANARQILSVSGGEQPELRLGGGLTRSSLWTQIVSDVLEVPVSVPATPEASAFGAALCAGAAAGVFRNLAEGADTLVRIARRHAPDAEQAQVYRGLYETWEELRAVSAQAREVASGLCLQYLVAPGPSAAHPPFHPRILITADMDEASLTELADLGSVEYASYREAMRLLAGPDLVEELKDCHVFVTEVDVVDAEALRQVPSLKVVVACRGNPVNVDVEACTALGIPVLHTPGRNADAVADLTLAFMLMLARTLPEATAFLREPGGEAGDMARMGQAHEALQGHELWGKTVGLVGLGAVGMAAARRLRPFGVRLLAHDPLLGEEEALLVGAELVSLDRLLGESDFVSLHAAVTDESRGLIGAPELAQMKPGAFFINTARAALVDEDALVDALNSGHLGGAAVDVFSVEPPASDHPLLALPNVIATPHVGGNTFEVAAHQGAIVTDDLKRLLRGECPHHVLNPETLDGFRWEGVREPVSLEALEELSARAAPAVSDLERASEPEVPSPDVPPRSKPEEGGIVGKGLSGLRRLRDRLGGESEPKQLAEAGTGAVSEARMERLLRAFIAYAADDPALADFASGRQVTMHYVLSDLGLEFYMRFEDGAVTGDLGAPPAQADVRLKMKTDVLDGMFTDRINATRAAMTGKLSFSGDTRLAMGMQRIQNDLIRLYSLAREEVGAPGDVAPAPPSAAPSSMKDLREGLLEMVNELYTVGCITATGGNVSVRVPDTDEILITPSQVFKGELRIEHLVRIDLNGEPVGRDALAPSSEWPMHCAVYRARSDVGAVIHSHAPQATVLALSDLPFLPISTEAAFLGELPRIPFIMPGTKELAEAVVEALADGSAVLMQNHGLLVAASGLRRAADLTEVIERTAEIILGCYAVGKEPPTLPDDVVAALREMGKMMA